MYESITDASICPPGLVLFNFGDYGENQIHSKNKNDELLSLSPIIMKAMTEHGHGLNMDIQN